MRIMQIGNSHHDYLKLFAKRFVQKTTHAELMRAYVNDYYWCCHTMTPALERLGHETFLCVPTERVSQRLWCEEHGVAWDESAPFLACLAQIEWFRPDILYIGSASLYHDELLDLLPYRPKLIVGWHATITRENMVFKNYDLILSSHEECLRISRQQGARHTAYAYPGIPAELGTKFSSVKRSDLCFSGYWAISHPRRNYFLYALSQRLPELPIQCNYHLGFYNGGPPCPDIVHRYNRGPVWGLAMFKAFASSRITLNGFCSINSGPQNLSPNMRQLEGMGVGSMMLTENSDNLEAFFTEGKDLVTYATIEELVEKARYYLAHEDEREAIAAQGLRTCLQYYNMDVRARALMDAVQRVLDDAGALPYDVLTRTLGAIQAAQRSGAAVAQDPDMRAIMAQALAATRRLLVQGEREKGTALLERIEQLPAEGMQQLNLCRALGGGAGMDNHERQRLLRQELDAWPENDLARECLSLLVRGEDATRALDCSK